MKTTKKTVTFSADVKEPQIVEKCSCCGHRNIIPKIREFLICTECNKQICCQCITSMSICLNCDWKIFGTVINMSGKDFLNREAMRNYEEI